MERLKKHLDKLLPRKTLRPRVKMQRFKKQVKMVNDLKIEYKGISDAANDFKQEIDKAAVKILFSKRGLELLAAKRTIYDTDGRLKEIKNRLSKNDKIAKAIVEGFDPKASDRWPNSVEVQSRGAAKAIEKLEGTIKTAVEIMLRK